MISLKLINHVISVCVHTESGHSMPFLNYIIKLIGAKLLHLVINKASITYAVNHLDVKKDMSVIQ